MRDSMARDGWWLAALFALAACGDDGGGAPAGEPCDTPGMSGDCRCEQNQGGRRTCTEDSVWTECSCSTVMRGPCVTGGVSECGDCPGQTAPRPAVCTETGNFDCSCPPLTGLTEGGVDASQGTDAGHDAGQPQDAGPDANGDDAGDSDAG